MSTPEEPQSKELTPQETAALLQQILDAVQKDERKHWVEIACAVLLSLAMLASAWCAYQANLWSGVQAFRLADANNAGRASSAANLSALQMRAFDASMFISYMQAKHEGNERHEKFLFDRFRPEMKKALDAWLKTDPFNNPAAPPGPFKMAEYAQKELDEAKGYDDLYAQKFAAAEAANEAGDRYVLLTVAFTTVLFFGGISGSFQSRRLRFSFFGIALVLFMVTTFFLETMPICHE
jgi:hypothetical protein